MLPPRACLQRDQSWWQTDGSFACELGTLTKHEVEEATIQYRAFDVDDDGLISFDDFAMAMQKHSPALARPEKRLQLEQMFHNADIDGSGAVRFLPLLCTATHLRWTLLCPSAGRCRRLPTDALAYEASKPGRRGSGDGGDGAS